MRSSISASKAAGKTPLMPPPSMVRTRRKLSPRLGCALVSYRRAKSLTAILYFRVNGDYTGRAAAARRNRTRKRGRERNGALFAGRCRGGEARWRGLERVVGAQSERHHRAQEEQRQRGGEGISPASRRIDHAPEEPRRDHAGDAEAEIHHAAGGTGQPRRD